MLAVKLSTTRPDYLMWFRKEQLQSVTWAGDPTKPMVGNDPLELSPRRSFAAWSEIVRGTALPWSRSELALARAFGAALVDIIVQVHAVRLLIAEHQLGADPRHGGQLARAGADRRRQRARCCSPMPAPRRCWAAVPAAGLPIADLFVQSALLRQAFDQLRAAHAKLARRTRPRARRRRSAAPVAVRAEIVPGRDRRALGFIVTLQRPERDAACRRGATAAGIVRCARPRTSLSVRPTR